MVITGLVLILVATLLLPLVSKKVEHNLEVFLFIVGVLAALISNVLSKDLIAGIFQNKFMYLITFAVFAGGILFKIFDEKIRKAVAHILNHVSIKVFVFIVIVVLGLVSSIITAIIASLLLVEIVNILPLNRKEKINVNIIACFSIGLGAAITPVGEPLSTIVISKVHGGFMYIFNLIGPFVIPTILLLGVLGGWFVRKESLQSITESENADVEIEKETYKGIIERTVKIFLFIIALDLLGSGFKPMIDTYVIKLNSIWLYFINTVSAILDNATLASAEISIKMSQQQIRVILLSLLVSGGMMIPGNIPNIVSAGKLKIKSSEWVKLGIPLGLIILAIYFVILFVI